MGWKQRHRVVLTWVAAATTPTVGSNHHWAVGSWCCLWVRVWDRAVVCPLAGFPPEDASLRPWAQRERRCSSGWPRLRLASPPSSPTRSRLARCHLHRRKRTAQLILWADECFPKDFTGQGLILCLLNIQEPSSYNTKGWKPSCVCVLKSLLVKKTVQRKTNIALLQKLQGHVCPAQICKWKWLLYYNTQTCFITTQTETAAAAVSHMNIVMCTMNMHRTNSLYATVMLHRSISLLSWKAPQAGRIKGNDILNMIML